MNKKMVIRIFIKGNRTFLEPETCRILEVENLINKDNEEELVEVPVSIIDKYVNVYKRKNTNCDVQRQYVNISNNYNYDDISLSELGIILKKIIEDYKLKGEKDTGNIIMPISILISKTSNGNETYYIEERTLYGLGDRNLANKDDSRRLITISMNYLDGLIDKYESINPEIKIDKDFISYASIDEDDFFLERLLFDYFDTRIYRYKTEKEKKDLSREEISDLIDKYVSSINIDNIKEELLDKYTSLNSYNKS